MTFRASFAIFALLWPLQLTWLVCVLTQKALVFLVSALIRQNSHAVCELSEFDRLVLRLVQKSAIRLTKCVFYLAWKLLKLGLIVLKVILLGKLTRWSVPVVLKLTGKLTRWSVPKAFKMNWWLIKLILPLSFKLLLLTIKVL